MEWNDPGPISETIITIAWSNWENPWQMPVSVDCCPAKIRKGPSRYKWSALSIQATSWVIFMLARKQSKWKTRKINFAGEKKLYLSMH